MQENKEFPNTWLPIVSSVINASWLLNACVLIPGCMYQSKSVFKFEIEQCACITTVSKSCLNKQLTDLGGLREIAEINSHSPFLPVCSECIFKLSYRCQSDSKLQLSESWYHRWWFAFVNFFFLFYFKCNSVQLAKEKKLKFLVIVINLTVSFFAFWSYGNLTSSDFLGTKRRWKIAQKAETWICPRSSPNWPFVWEWQEAHNWECSPCVPATISSRNSAHASGETWGNVGRVWYPSIALPSCVSYQTEQLTFPQLTLQLKWERRKQ